MNILSIFRPAAPPPPGTYPDVDDHQMTMADGTPIVCLLRWWAARHRITREEATAQLDAMAYGEQFEAWRTHQQYLRERGLH